MLKILNANFDGVVLEILFWITKSVTTGEFELWKICMQTNNLIHQTIMPTELDGFEVSDRILYPARGVVDLNWNVLTSSRVAYLNVVVLEILLWITYSNDHLMVGMNC